MDIGDQWECWLDYSHYIGGQQEWSQAFEVGHYVGGFLVCLATQYGLYWNICTW